MAVFWYVAAYCVGLIFDAVYRYFSWDSKGSVSAKLVYGFLAALPVAYVLVFLALLAGYLAVFEQSPQRSWPLVLFGTGITALSLSWFRGFPAPPGPFFFGLRRFSYEGCAAFLLKLTFT